MHVEAGFFCLGKCVIEEVRDLDHWDEGQNFLRGFHVPCGHIRDAIMLSAGAPFGKQVGDPVRLPYRLALVVEFELYFAGKAVRIEPLVVGKEGRPWTKCQNVPFVLFGRRERVGSSDCFREGPIT